MWTPPTLTAGRREGTNSSGPSSLTSRPIASLAARAIALRQGATLIDTSSEAITTAARIGSRKSASNPIRVQRKTFRNVAMETGTWAGALVGVAPLARLGLADSKRFASGSYNAA